jgi:hypothetical protein
MTEASKIPTPGTAQPGASSGDYKAAHRVKARASVTRSAESPEIRKSVTRLNTILASGRPLDGDMPRGFYLNIRV